MSQSLLTPFEQSLLALIQTHHRGRDNSLKIEQIMQHFAPSSLTQRAVKKAIENIHDAGFYLLGSSRYAGVFWITNSDEFQLCWMPYLKQARKMYQTGSAAQRVGFREFAGQVSFSFEEGGQAA